MKATQEEQNKFEDLPSVLEITELEEDDDLWRKAIVMYERGLSDTLIDQEQTPLKKCARLTVLVKLGITETDLSKAQVNIPALQSLLVKQHPLGKAWYFFISVSWLRMLCTPLCLSQHHIKQVSTDDPSQDSGKPLLPKVTHQTTTCRPLILSSALLFESQTVLRKAAALKTFQDTIQLLIDGTWGLFISSLIINAVVNVILYPDMYSDQNKIIYLVSLPLTVGKYLQNALSNMVVYIPLVAIPLTLGLINALRAAYRIPLKTQDHNTQIQELIQQLKLHEQSFWRDVVGWILSTTLPNAIPLAGICALIPQVRIQQALERITFALIWDGRLSVQARTTLFDGLRQFSHASRHLTQLQAIGVLAEVLSGITVSEFRTLQKVGVDDDILKALLFIKTEAFRELRYLANTTRLPQEAVKGKVGHLPRYLRANYELWRLGFPQHHALQPVFFVYQGGRLVLSVFLYISVGSALYTIFVCLIHGNQWTFIEEAGEYKCHVCGDLPIIYRNIFTVEDCFQAYFAFPRTLEAWDQFVDRFNVNELRSLDLSAQIYLFSNLTAFTSLLDKLKPKLIQLQTFRLEVAIPNQSLSDGLALAITRFIQNSSVTHFIFHELLSKEGMLQNIINSLANTLPYTQLRYLELNAAEKSTEWNYSANSSLLMTAIPNSSVIHLNMNYLTSDTKMLASMITNSTLEELWLRIEMNALDQNPNVCMLFFEQVTKSKLKYLSFEVILSSLSDYCAMALAKWLPSMQSTLNLSFSMGLVQLQGVDGLIALTNALSKSTSLKSFSLRTDIFFTGFFPAQLLLSNLVDAIPGSSLKELSFNVLPLYLFNFTQFVPRFAVALSQSNVTSLHFIDCTLVDDFINHLAPFLPTFKNLTELDLFSSNLSPDGTQALAAVLNQTNIQILSLQDQPSGNDNGIVAIAKALPTTSITQLNLTSNRVSSETMLFLAHALKDSKMSVLDLSDNLIQEINVKEFLMACLNSPVKILGLGSMNMSNKAAQTLATFLTRKSHSTQLWIDQLNPERRPSYQSATNLISISLVNNSITNEGMMALCQVWPYTQLSYFQLINDMTLQNNGSFSYHYSIEQCGVYSSGPSLRPALPILLLFRLPRVLLELYFPDPQGHMAQPTKIIENCLVIFQQQSICDETALQPYTQVVQDETVIHTPLYDNVLVLCQTFLQSAGQSAMFTAFPLLATKLLHQYGGYDLEKAKTISQVLQISLLFAFSNSKTALTAGFLSNILASQLTQSPQIITNVTVGASIVSTILETVLTQDVSFTCLALQMGVGLMGAMVGSWGFYQVSKAGQWVTEKAQAVTACLHRLSFWQLTPVNTAPVIQPEDEISASVARTHLPINVTC